MKKHLSLALVALMIAALLAGCGGSEQPSDSQQSSDTQQFSGTQQPSDAEPAASFAWPTKQLEIGVPMLLAATQTSMPAPSANICRTSWASP